MKYNLKRWGIWKKTIGLEVNRFQVYVSSKIEKGASQGYGDQAERQKNQGTINSPAKQVFNGHFTKIQGAGLSPTRHFQPKIQQVSQRFLKACGDR